MTDKLETSEEIAVVETGATFTTEQPVNPGRRRRPARVRTTRSGPVQLRLGPGVADSQSIDPVRLELLIAADERKAAQSSRLAYVSAFALMASRLPVVRENGRITVGEEVVGTYGLWEDINEAIRPVLRKYGFALSFRTGQAAETVIVTAVLTHKDGHSEETTLHLPPDPGPSRNSVQAVGSSVSYGKRYAACALLNITTRGDDDDGRAAAGTVAPEEVHVLEEAIAAAQTSRNRFLRYLRVDELEHLPASRFADAMAALKAKADAKRGAI